MTKPETMDDLAGDNRDASRSPHDPSMAATRMVYVADLLLELKVMAAAEGHTTLAGLLALAHSEAITKVR